MSQAIPNVFSVADQKLIERSSSLKSRVEQAQQDPKTFSDRINTNICPLHEDKLVPAKQGSSFCPKCNSNATSMRHDAALENKKRAAEIRKERNLVTFKALTTASKRETVAKCRAYLAALTQLKAEENGLDAELENLREQALQAGVLNKRQKTTTNVNFPSSPRSLSCGTSLPYYAAASGNQQPAPTAGNHALAAGNHPPAFGNQQPAPAAGNHALAAGNHPPAAGNHPPAFGNQQPASAPPASARPAPTNSVSVDALTTQMDEVAVHHFQQNGFQFDPSFLLSKPSSDEYHLWSLEKMPTKPSKRTSPMESSNKRIQREELASIIAGRKEEMDLRQKGQSIDLQHALDPSSNLDLPEGYCFKCVHPIEDDEDSTTCDTCEKDHHVRCLPPGHRHCDVLDHELKARNDVQDNDDDITVLDD